MAQGSPTKIIHADDLKKFIRNSFSFTGLFRKPVETRDKFYFLYNFIDIDKAIQNLPVVPDYQPEIFDCNSQTDFIIGNLRAIIPGAACCYIKAVTDDSRSRVHAWCAIIDSDMTVFNMAAYRDSHDILRAGFDLTGHDTKLKYNRIISIRF